PVMRPLPLIGIATLFDEPTRAPAIARRAVAGHPVVLDYEGDRQVLAGRVPRRFVIRADAGRHVADEAPDVRPSESLERKGYPGCDRKDSADHRRGEEAVLREGQVHAVTGENLLHHQVSRDAVQECVVVRAIGREHPVGRWDDQAKQINQRLLVTSGEMDRRPYIPGLELPRDLQLEGEYLRFRHAISLPF